MAEKLGKWASNRGLISKIRPSDGCKGDTVPSTVVRGYDLCKPGGHLGNVGQYEVATPAEYLAALADDWRRDTLLQLRAIIQQIAPDWQEGIEYKMLSYSDESGPVMHLNAQKNFVALYIGDVAKVDPDGVLLGAMDLGKGCIRFKRTNVVAESGIGGFLDRFISLRARGAELGC